MTRRAAPVRCGVAIVAVLLASPNVAAAASPGPAVDLGNVTIVKADNPGSMLAGGRAGTEFRVVLPAGATCPGDSATDQWRLQTFMVPSAVDVGALEYGGIGPTGADQFALFTADAAQHSWANEILPQNTSDVPATPVPALPIFSFAAVSAVKVSEGSYRVGVACTLFGATAQYWDALIDVTGSALGNPSSFRWTVVGAPPPATGDGPSAWMITALIVVGLLGAGVVVAALRRARTTSSKQLQRKEHR